MKLSIRSQSWRGRGEPARENPPLLWPPSEVEIFILCYGLNRLCHIHTPRSACHRRTSNVPPVFLCAPTFVSPNPRPSSLGLTVCRRRSSLPAVSLWRWQQGRRWRSRGREPPLTRAQSTAVRGEVPEATPFSLELRHERFRQGAGRFRALLCDLRRKTDALIEWHVPRGP